MVAPPFTKILSIAVIVTLLVSSVEPTCPSTPKNINDGKKETYLVLLKKKEGATKKHFETLETCWNKRVEHVTPNSKSNSNNDEDVIHDFSVKGSIQGYSGKFTDSFVKMLSEMDNVDLIEKEIPLTIQYAIPQNFSLIKRAVAKNPPKNLDRIDQAKGFDGKFVFPDSAGKGVNIFVVDTGIRTTHNEFAGGRAKFGGSFCDGCNDDDENGHGTQVASIAAGKTFGVARNANLVAVRVLDAKGAGNNVGVINGLSFVADQHKSGKSKNTVVNMSLGGGFSAAVNSAVKDLTDAGVHVAVAAGNESQDACKTSPASELSAVTVGATEDDSDNITDFSNFGKCLDIFAPGRDIPGAGIKSDDDIAILSGTSQATPHVAGTLALLIAEDGNKAPAALAKDLNNLSTKGAVKGIGKTNSPDSFLRTPAP